VSQLRDTTSLTYPDVQRNPGGFSRWCVTATLGRQSWRRSFLYYPLSRRYRAQISGVKCELKTRLDARGCLEVAKKTRPMFGLLKVGALLVPGRGHSLSVREPGPSDRLSIIPVLVETAPCLIILPCDFQSRPPSWFGPTTTEIVREGSR
jgi:hypothetical protein